MRMRDIERLLETASCGATGAGNVASLPGNGKSSTGSIGAGFDPDGDYGIYPKPKKKPNKAPAIIKRNSSR